MLLTLKRKNKKGFTLIELIVVVAILAILAAIAVPSFVGMAKKAQAGVDIANAAAIAGAINVYNSMQSSDGTKLTAAAGAKATLDAAAVGLWPKGIKAADEGNAIARVTVANFVATVNSDITWVAPAPPAGG